MFKDLDAAVTSSLIESVDPGWLALQSSNNASTSKGAENLTEVSPGGSVVAVLPAPPIKQSCSSAAISARLLHVVLPFTSPGPDVMESGFVPES